MKHSSLKKILSFTIATSILFGCMIPAMASDTEEDEAEETEVFFDDSEETEVGFEEAEEAPEDINDSDVQEEAPEEDEAIEVLDEESVDVSAGLDLQTAIDDAESGSTIVLTDDVNQSVVIPEGKIVTINLNGFTITSSDITIANDGVLTIIGDGMVVGTNNALTNTGTLSIQGGTYSNSANGKYVIENTNELSIENAYIYGSSCVFQEEGSMSIGQGSSLVCSGVDNNNSCVFLRSGDIEINGGYFEGKYNIYEKNLIASGTGYRQYKGFGNRIIINGGVFQALDNNIYSPSSGIYDSVSCNYIIINGGAFESSSYSIYQDYNEAENNKIEINDGIFKCNGFIYERGVHSIIYVNGGTVDNEGNVFITEEYYNCYGADTIITSLTLLSSVDKSIFDKAKINGALICLEDGNAVWYVGTAASRATRNAESGSEVNIISGVLSVSASHDLIVSVDDGATAIINGFNVPSDGDSHVIHVGMEVASSHPCLSPDSPQLYYCSDCGKYFEDAEGTVEVTDPNAIDYIYNHSLTLVPEKPATTTEDGYEAYYVCDECGEMFSDSEGNNPISEPVVIPKLALTPTWKHNSKGWWYQRADGTYPKSCWEEIDGKWYHFNDSGYMETGWIKSGSSWYYCDSSGAMVTGWKQISGKWYYLKSSGAMATGWLKVGASWYYFNSSGVMQTDWIKISGKWYYLGTNGKMVTGTKVINGKSYTFNSSGVCLNP